MIKVTNLQEMNRIENGSLQMHIQKKAEAMMQEYQVENMDDIGCFAAYAGQFYQFFKGIGYLTVEFFHQHLCHAYKMFSFVVGIGDAADILVYHGKGRG